jgi:hypothetical protein
MPKRSADLEEYAFSHDRCCVCWWPKYRPGRPLHVHHICSRRRGEKAHSPANLCLLCRDCHEGFHSGGQRDLKLGHVLWCKREEDGLSPDDLKFLAWLYGRAALKEEPSKPPRWVYEERKNNETLRPS